MSVRVWRSTDFPLNEVEQAVVFDTVRWDTDQMFDVNDPRRLTARVPGVYYIWGASTFRDADATAQCGLRIRKNGELIAVNDNTALVHGTVDTSTPSL